MKQSGWHRKKPSPADTRGYGKDHRDARKAALAALTLAGTGACCRCGGLITPAMRLHLDHTPDRTGYLGLSHGSCNERAGARNAARVANAKRKVSRLAM